MKDLHYIVVFGDQTDDTDAEAVRAALENVLKKFIARATGADDLPIKVFHAVPNKGPENVRTEPSS